MLTFDESAASLVGCASAVFDGWTPEAMWHTLVCGSSDAVRDSLRFHIRHGSLLKILISWSTGKDSAWTLHLLRQQHPGAVAGLLTTVNEAYDRVAMHAVRRTLLQAQAEATGLPLYAIDLPYPCSNSEYERRMADAVGRFVRDGFTHVAFGDLFLEDVRRYREERLAGTGLAPMFPLWKTKPTARLAKEMVDSNIRAYLTCVDPRALPASFAGREFDVRLLADLPAGIDPCGENGEFHSFVWDGPMFSRPLAVRTGATVERDGFVFSDIEPCRAPACSQAPPQALGDHAPCSRAASSV